MVALGALGAVFAPPESAADIGRLRARSLQIPVQAVDATALADNYLQSREAGARTHEALDIPAPLGTPVVAVEDGRIAKLFLSKPGGITVYQFDPRSEFAYYYAHLDRYADGLKEGAQVRRGEVIGYVGTTGNAAGGAPHLHFAIFRLGPERQWWRGSPLNPFLVWRDAAH
ncbi:M23 family metallopeptidase [Caenimonas sp. DR4.4]|uniref:M23 family metallopeptidase n=2 Tax=Caenimonas aquaedulcis TaxID=2793270 RepID=A0A931MIE3_9BURK|nr:M23 family metallopeptidase [Caenimonas aquaedulcis]MBG9389165.1 M23 family metallopeptidase [Caenimonas aquaedulcis]